LRNFSVTTLCSK